MVCEAFASTIVEKLSPLDKNSAPGRDAAVVVSCVHVPLPTELEFAGINLHSDEPDGVVQEPVYTDISPFDAMIGINAVSSLLLKGKLEVIVVSPNVDEDKVADMLRDTRCCSDPDCRKAYAILLMLVENRGRNMVVGLYGRD